MSAFYHGSVAAQSAVSDNGETKTFEAVARLDTPMEVEYFKNGGILQYVLRQLLKEQN